MENLRQRLVIGSFTVEATFVIPISIWIVVLVCYLAMYAHDETVLVSLGHNYLEMAFENGENPSVSSLETNMQKYLQKHLLIGQVDEVAVKKTGWSVCASFTYQSKVSESFIKKLLTGKEGRKVSVSRERFLPAERMWESEIFEFDKK